MIKNYIFQKYFVLVLMGLTFFLSEKVYATVGDAIRYLPVQDAGRVKPYDTFAREVLEIIYGKSTYKTETGENAPAHLVVMTWMLSPESWLKRPLFEVNHLDVKTKLGLASDQKYFTSLQLFDSDKFQNLMQELADKRASREKMTPYFQALQRLQNQMIYFRELTAGRLLKVMPNPNSDTWLSISEVPEEQQKLFISVSQSIATYLGALTDQSQVEQAARNLDEAVLRFEASIRDISGDAYAASRKTRAEVFYYDIHPFRWAYILYFLAAITLLFIWIRNLSSGMTVVWMFTWVGFIIHTAGFLFRVYLAERAPVTNMYETVVWMSWGLVLFAMILEKIYKFKSLLLAGVLVGFVSMVIADSAPAILDPGIQPLEAVLRSNYWLIVHVMTITISYAAFALAFGLGDMGLVYYVIDSEKYKDQIQNNNGCLSRYANRCGIFSSGYYFRWYLGGLFLGAILGLGS